MPDDFPLRVLRIRDDQLCLPGDMRDQPPRIQPLRQWMRIAQRLESHVVNRHDVWPVFRNRREEVRVVADVRPNAIKNFRQQEVQINRAYRKVCGIRELQISV